MEALKERFSDWVKDIHDDPTGPKKVKRKKRMSKKKLALQRAMKPTASSELKHTGNRKQETALPVLSMKTPSAESFEQVQRRRHHVLAQTINFVSNAYNHPHLPGIGFFPWLVSMLQRKEKAGLISSQEFVYDMPWFPVQVPPTLIRIVKGGCESGLDICMLFVYSYESDLKQSHLSSSCGLRFQLYRSQEAFEQQHRQIARLLCGHQANLETKCIAAVVKAFYDDTYSGSTVQSLSTYEDVMQFITSFWSTTGDVPEEDNSSSCSYCAVQRYISSKGSTTVGGPAWIVRGVYSRRQQSTDVWVLTDADTHLQTTPTNNKDEMYSGITSSNDISCHIVRSTNTTQSWPSVRAVMSELPLLLEPVLKTRFDEMVVDLLQDDKGTWWMLQMKAFKVTQGRPKSSRPQNASANVETWRSPSAPPILKASRKRWACAGKYCRYPPRSLSDCDSNNNCSSRLFDDDGIEEDGDEPSGVLSRKVVLSCDFYDRYMTEDDISIASGWPSFDAALKFHMQHGLNPRTRQRIYEPQPLCTKCVGAYHRLHTACVKLLNSEGVAEKKPDFHHKQKSTRSAIQKRIHNLPKLEHAPSFASPFDIHVSDRELLTSMSTPVLPMQRPVVSPANDVDEDGCTSYLEEMDRIEQLLGEHEVSRKQDDEIETGILHSKWFRPDYSSLCVDSMWDTLDLPTLSKGSNTTSKRTAYNTLTLDNSSPELTSDQTRMEQSKEEKDPM